jgi:hypothetical protein
MKSQLEVDRKFFLEVIDDLAKDAAQNAHGQEMTPVQHWAHIQRGESGTVTPFRESSGHRAAGGSE